MQCAFARLRHCMLSTLQTLLCWRTVHKTAHLLHQMRENFVRFRGCCLVMRLSSADHDVLTRLQQELNTRFLEDRGLLPRSASTAPLSSHAEMHQHHHHHHPHHHLLDTPIRRTLDVVCHYLHRPELENASYMWHNKLDGCIVWNAHNTVFGSKRSAICAHAVYFLHSTMPSVTCLRLSDVSVICHVTYLQLPIQVCFSSMSASQAGGTAAYLVYPISHIWRRRKFGEVSCTERTGQRNDFKSIPSVKMETRHPVEGWFGSEFPAIYNHCGVIAAWSRKTLKFSRIFFFGKTTLSKFCSESFHQDADRRVVFKFRKIWPTGNRWNRALLTWQNISPGSPAVATGGSRPKFARASSRQCTQSAPDFIQIGSLSAQL